ncbi:hypothetical protein [Enterococcus wangshanyuanii]|uniref:Uncharacterized protein n=1 Tax=Enterococcus wangshanyuanii TaxID=2005703 RepID=A0ABQ1PTY2_9ENTE|nr:hypothetical protein [Enterococcus wangshanyuanii]GGD03542.1 hypothetical protein GCM10011573_36240 [Enterococcus wangshanyuanii]
MRKEFRSLEELETIMLEEGLQYKSVEWDKKDIEFHLIGGHTLLVDTSEDKTNLLVTNKKGYMIAVLHRVGEVDKSMLNTFTSPVSQQEVVEVQCKIRDKITGKFGKWFLVGNSLVPSGKTLSTLKKKGKWAVGKEDQDGAVERYALKTKAV